ncbi:hypothetical protein H206_06183 [Candidatus Electrothrix aarhusensis]|uniref:Uncharacterized protein n=1 Tax=Candidatus Electrothrix aarhusensis TaxID=1859131 RepID=A0A3S3SQ94_9BACT|nr:hypothetical protein H206_06183 [Candidatus Electrothrix aarhusensis]
MPLQMIITRLKYHVITTYPQRNQRAQGPDH